MVLRHSRALVFGSVMVMLLALLQGQSVRSAQAAPRAENPPVNLVTNGSFENPSVWQTSPVTDYGSGSTAMPGWTVGGNSVDLVGSSYWAAEDGHQSVDLSGSAPGSVSEVVGTKAGSYYLLAWYLAGNPNCGQPVKTMDVEWDGKVVDAPQFTVAGQTSSSMGWMQFQVYVRASGARSTMSFADATPDHSQCGAALDNVSLIAATVAKPAIPQAIAPLATLSGVPYSAAFFASGIASYRLTQAPSWLTIQPSGAVSGTPPTGTKSFTFGVTAFNADGTASAGPYTVSVQSAAPVSGTVTDGGIAANPVAGTTVQACTVSQAECAKTTTASDGTYIVKAPLGQPVIVTAYPLPGSGDATTSTSALTVPAAGLAGETISLNGITPLPNGLTVNGTTAPTVFWANPSTVSVKGCPNGVAFVSVTGENTQTGQLSSDFVVLDEKPVGSGKYTGTIPPLEPIHGPVDIRSSVSCPQTGPVMPQAGPAGGGGTVTIVGSGFSGVSRVTFGGKPASFTVLSPDAISAVVPPGQGAVPVSVFDTASPSGTAAGQYTYQAVQSVTPSSGPASGRTWVIVKGLGLLTARNVFFGKVPALDYIVLSDTELEALSPPGTGTVDISVATGNGQTAAVTADKFSYTTSGPAARAAAVPRPPVAAPGPVPAAAIPDFAGTKLANSIARFIYRDGSELLTARSAINDISDDVVQLLKGPRNCKQSEADARAQILLALDPILGAIAKPLTPEVAFAALEIFGALGPAGWVVGVIVAALTPVILSELLEFIAEQVVDAALEKYFDGLYGPNCGQGEPPPPPLPRPPPPPGSNPHCSPATSSCGYSPTGLVNPSGEVLDTNGHPISGATVTVMVAATATGPFTAVKPSSPGISPRVNPERTGASGQFHWDVAAGWYEIQAKAAKCADPKDPYQHTVTIGPYQVPPPRLGLTIVMACRNEPKPPHPAVSGLSTTVSAIRGGATITILGSGFTPASTVQFGRMAGRKVTYLSAQSLRVTVPRAHKPGLVDVRVRSQGGTSKTNAADKFFYGSIPSVKAVAPRSGPVKGGTKVTITGSGFYAVRSVIFGGAAARKFTVVSPTRIVAIAPKGRRTGTVDIEIQNPAGLNALIRADRFRYR